MLLSYTELCELIEQGLVTGTDEYPISFNDVNSASLDIHLSDTVLVDNERRGKIIDYANREKPSMQTVRIHRADGYVLAPGEGILASSTETFNLPSHISAEYKLKSSMARIFLEHLNAGWCDAGWHGSRLTLELINLSCTSGILRRPGDAIGQVVFFKHAPVPYEKSYAARGRYNNDGAVSGIKP